MSFDRTESTGRALVEALAELLETISDAQPHCHTRSITLQCQSFDLARDIRRSIVPMILLDPQCDAP